MFRVPSFTGRLALLRSPATLHYIGTPRSFKEDWKTLHTKDSEAAGIARNPNSAQSKPTQKRTRTSTRRKSQATLNEKNTGGPVEEDGDQIGLEEDARKRNKPKKRKDVTSSAPVQGKDGLIQYLFEGYGGSHKKGRTKVGDSRRVQIVSKELCDDIIERMKPSLEKHVGCDIIDLNPGPGIWSSAIHDFLKPRTHVLMEPDDALYRPLLQPLLDAEGSTYKLIPKSGVVWAFLQQALSPELLPHQKVREPGDPRLEEQNDTLLVLANLGYYPKKPYRGFSSISSLVIYQLLSAARSHSLFHKYGLIRMLIWVEDEEKKMVLPRSIVNRRKSSVEAEVTCGDIFEVASSTDAVGVSLRDHNLDLESSMAVLKRMDEAGIKTPKNRQGALEMEATKSSSRDISAESQIVKREFYKELEDLERRFDAEEFSMFQDSPEGRQALETFQSLQTSARSPKLQTPEWTRMALLTKAETRWKKEAPKSTFKHEDELRELRERFAAGEFQQYQLSEDGLPKRVNKTSMAKYYTPEYKRLEYLRTRSRMENKRVARAMALSDEYDEILTMQKEILSKDGSEADSLRQEIDRRTEEWKEEMQLMNNEDDRALVYNMLDNRSAFHRDPPVLYWDRRKAEPLKTDPQEFFPKAEMALLDFQPQPLWPVLRENFPANYDVFEYIVSNLLMIPTQSIRQGLSSLAPGAFEWLVQECPSISDPNKGGNPDHDFMRVRTLTLEMYKEMTEAWLRWPFRPSRYDLLSLMGSEVHDPDAAEVGERV